jgi:hypothetical protein
LIHRKSTENQTPPPLENGRTHVQNFRRKKAMSARILGPCTLVGSAIVVMLAIHFVARLRTTGAATAAPGVDAQSLSPGTECTFTASLVGTIHEVTDDAVVFSVNGLEDQECGIPVVSKSPHYDRVFTNVGVVREETRFLLEIPRQRLESLAAEEAGVLR